MLVNCDVCFAEEPSPGEAGQVLVTSDVSIRGIDFQDASHVVIFDFPRTAAEYIHMAGRTARAGTEGKRPLVSTHPRRRPPLN